MPSWMTVQLMPESEREALVNILDVQRIGLIRKVEDVSDELARQTPTASSLSLLGLIKHAATWEQRWFQAIMAGRQLPDRWPDVNPEPRDADLMARESDTVSHWIAVYREQIDMSNEIVASMDLGTRSPLGPPRVQPALRPAPHDRGNRPPRRHHPRDSRRSAGHLSGGGPARQENARPQSCGTPDPA